MLGLIGIQFYWISNAFVVKESNFNRDVSESVSSAIYKYNKVEMANAFLHGWGQENLNDRIFDKIDSLNHEYYLKAVSQYQLSPDSIQDSLKIVLSDSLIIQEMDNGNDSGDFLDYRGDENRSRGGYADRTDNFDTTENLYWNFFERSKMVNDLFDEIFSPQEGVKPVNAPNLKVLDSLIMSELDRSGIRTEYEFGIYEPVYNRLVQEKTGNYTQQLLESDFAFSLFPNDVFRSSEYLLLYFPDQQNYLLRQMNFMTIVSVIFILVIITSFTYTIITLIRQKQLSLMKNDFINNMTHELKTPISTISLACQALRDKDVQKSETLYQNYINVINEENERLGLMTQKVLQTAQLEKGKIRLNKSGFNFHDVIEDAIRKIDLQLKAFNGHIKTALNAEFSYLEADKIHLTNVVFNLLDNAIKYSQESPEITIITDNVNNGIQMHVKDNGIGISKNNQKKIFDNLYRISTGNLHNVKGFGLGLSYVKAIVEMHGGHVKLSSELKKGSTFTVFIPFGFQ